jgi:DNA replication protein DnaC
MTMSILEMKKTLKQLRLSGVLATLDTRLLEAQTSNLSALDVISDLLQDELDRRHTRLLDKCLQRSGLPERATLAEFDWTYNPQIPKRTCFELNTLKFIAEGSNAILVGKAGTGKSHVAKAIAYSAVREGTPQQSRARRRGTHPQEEADETADRCRPVGARRSVPSPENRDGGRR